jgi:lysophospholipase L1-like esterase
VVKKSESNSESAEVGKLKHDAEQRIHSGESAKSALQHEATTLRHHETKHGHVSNEHYDHEMKLLKKALQHDGYLDLGPHVPKPGRQTDRAEHQPDRAGHILDRDRKLLAQATEADKTLSKAPLEIPDPFTDHTRVGREPAPNAKAGELPFSAGTPGQLEVKDEHKKLVDIWPSSHNALVDKARSTAPDTAMFGDSITDGMSLNNDLANLHGKTANFGIHGDSTQNLRYRLEHGELNFKDGKVPKNFVVLIGTNDIGKGKSNEQIARDAMGDAELIAKKFPQSKVQVLGLLPRGGYRDEVNDINKYLKHDVSDRHNSNIRFCDIGPSMLEKDGSMSSDLWQPDFTHPTYQHGYSRLLGAIKKVLDSN